MSKSSLNNVGRPKSSERRRAILDVAAELFLEHGYVATSMNEIVSRIGGSKATIYAHFDNKEGLFAGVVDDLLGDILQALKELDVGHMELSEGLEFVGRRSLEVLNSERGVALQRLVFAESARAPEIALLYYEHGPGQGHRHLEDFLRRQQKQGNLINLEPVRAADYFLGLLLHKITLQRHYGVVKTLSARQIKQHVTRVVDDFMRLCN